MCLRTVNPRLYRNVRLGTDSPSPLFIIIISKMFVIVFYVKHCTYIVRSWPKRAVNGGAVASFVCSCSLNCFAFSHCALHMITSLHARSIQILVDIKNHKPQLDSVERLSTQLLYLEPTFDGSMVHSDLQVHVRIRMHVVCVCTLLCVCVFRPPHE